MSQNRPIPAGFTGHLRPVHSIETHGQRAVRLSAEAADAAARHAEDFVIRLDSARSMAAEIAAGGDAYPHGVREEARQLAESLSGSILRLEQIARRRGRQGVAP